MVAQGCGPLVDDISADLVETLIALLVGKLADECARGLARRRPSAAKREEISRLHGENLTLDGVPGWRWAVGA